MVDTESKRRQMIDFEIVQKKWETDPAFVKAKEELKIEFEIASFLIRQRKSQLQK
ncbi:hypothetical protein SAMN04488056_12914 [Cohaesibacter marisflavi]|uniref:Uncharacterized protein n=1 Tax=Cohaesibacter marisflavi TaxID=655353 RepID=A0A1I5NE28_9HYPH|nr:hypothetical protein SAMN04488056_12914 [Cohaesibacter marisflavi]